MTDEEKALAKLAEEGIHVRVVSIDHLKELKRDLDELLEKGLIIDDLRTRYLDEFRYDPPKSMARPTAVVVAAIAQPAYKVTFVWKGKEVPTIVPPTYVDGKSVMDHVRARLRESFGAGRYDFRKAKLPLKTLAARSGLSKYGRNNIAYVDGLGSFHRLTANFTNYPFKRDDWQEREALPKCATCRACRKACPTGAISQDRFLLHAERCLVYLNERPPEYPFPDWVRPEWHNAVIGCMKCQRACPYDSEVIGWVEEGAKFDEADTKLMLSGNFVGRRAAVVKRRLEKVGLDLEQMPRNLSVLLR